MPFLPYHQRAGGLRELCLLFCYKTISKQALLLKSPPAALSYIFFSLLGLKHDSLRFEMQFLPGIMEALGIILVSLGTHST